jgi:hypothetical protein
MGWLELSPLGHRRALFGIANRQANIGRSGESATRKGHYAPKLQFTP